MPFDRDVVIQILRNVASENMQAYEMAHKNENQHPEAWDWIILGARALNLIDSNYGMNGKRGNTNDPSSDAIVYGKGRGVPVFDVLIGAGEHGRDLNRITCQDVTDDSKLDGQIMTVWIDPFSRETVGVIDGPGPEPEPDDLFKWQAKHQDLLNRFRIKNPQPSLGGDAARAWIKKLAQQFAFTYSNEGWGVKSSGGLQSSDILAVKNPFTGFRVLPLNNNPQVFDLKGQNFISVIPVDHLNESEPGAPPVGNLPPRDEQRDELNHLHHVYKNELKRENGLWINGAPDFEGIAAWFIDTYLRARMAGKSREEARKLYVDQIRASEEWKNKNSDF